MHWIAEHSSEKQRQQDWDPHLSKDIQAIEKVQRIAARWVKSNYNWENSVTSMLSELQWPTLNIRRCISRLTILYQGLRNLISLATSQPPPI